MSRPVRQGPDSDPGPDPDFDPETEANGISSEAPKALRGCAPDPDTPPALVLKWFILSIPLMLSETLSRWRWARCTWGTRTQPAMPGNAQSFIPVLRRPGRIAGIDESRRVP